MSKERFFVVKLIFFLYVFKEGIEEVEYLLAIHRRAPFSRGMSPGVLDAKLAPTAAAGLRPAASL
jgi:hypothetical protein